MTLTETLQDTIDRACAALPTRAQYAREVIRGTQRWSGADLKGKAKKFGAAYARQRSVAMRAWHDAGGVIVAVEHGRNVSAIEAGTDAQGRAVYLTVDGIAVLDAGRQNARLITDAAPRVLVEYMPEWLVSSHRAAGNWGEYPGNGALREWMDAAAAHELIDADADGYARLVPA